MLCTIHSVADVAETSDATSSVVVIAVALARMLLILRSYLTGSLTASAAAPVAMLADYIVIIAASTIAAIAVTLDCY